MNGVRISMTATDAKKCCRVGLGTSIRISSAWLTVATALRLLGPTAMGFDVCQEPISTEPHEVRFLTEMMWILGGGKFSSVELSCFISVVTKASTI